ncbi:unnamed protein product [Allacma fusca]|uniref:N-acetylmuramoyl-L-alanine amidase domain-containing protein n=1 Tax=Allacma fusca TaxID=39272 RepID=A0A8J2KMS6_9HEXA|nr:unnamed protein product [Allacma fusca]
MFSVKASVAAFCLLFVAIDLSNCQREPGALWMPSPHHYSGRNGYAPKWLILHGTAGGSSAENIARWFQNPDSQVAAHYVIGQDGKVVQCVDESSGAWANGRIESGADSWWSVNPNYVTISIEHVKPKTDNSDAITPAQKTASFNLVRNIISRYPAIRKAWANSAGGITGHFSISPISRERCPGPYPWEELFAFLNGGSGGDECYGTVTASGGLFIRAQPNSGSAMVGSLNYGSQHRLSGRSAGESINGNSAWFKVPNGYVSGYWLQLSGGASWCNSNVHI